MELAFLSGTDVFLSIYNIVNQKVFEFSTKDEFTTSILDKNLKAKQIVKFEPLWQTLSTGERVVSLLLPSA